MIDELKKNVETEIGMLREISNYLQRIEYASETDKKLMESAITSLQKSIKLINKSIPGILKTINLDKKLPSTSERPKVKGRSLSQIQINRPGSEVSVVLNKADRARFLKELSISDSLIKRFKSKQGEKKEEDDEFGGSRKYYKISNRVFLNLSNDLIKKGYFKTLSRELKRSNFNVLLSSFVSMALMSSMISIFVGLLLVIILLFFDVGLTFPFFSAYDGAILQRFLKVFWIPFVLPFAVFAFLIYYPSTEKQTIGKKIDQELPFAVIHMSAISGSGIAPAEIFRIIGLSKEYKYLRKEIRKVLNQINLYGYDLVTALNNAAKSAPSENLSDLFSGLSTTITSGANLNEFFEKRAETLLLGYRLEREKYTKVAETFLDIYISIVVAAPMIFLLLIIMMVVSGIQVGFNANQIAFLTVIAVALLNVFFLIFLQIKQPSY